ELEADALGFVAAVENGLPPWPVLQIPGDGLGDPALEILFGTPAQFNFDLRSINGVTPVVAWAIGDKRDQASARSMRGGFQPIEQLADRLHDVQIGALVAASDIVGLAGFAARDHERQRFGMVLDIEPVANLLAVAVDRQRLAG